MIYMIVGIYKTKGKTTGYKAIALNESIESLQPETIKIPITADFSNSKTEFANAIIENGKIARLTTSDIRYPHFDEATGRAIPTKKYSHRYKIILVARCAARASGGLIEFIFYINGKLTVVSGYPKLAALRDKIKANNGTLSNGSFREGPKARPEITTYGLSLHQKEISLYRYAKPVMKDIAASNAKRKQELITQQKEMSKHQPKEPAIPEDTTEPIILTPTSVGQYPPYASVAEDGTLVQWTGDKVNPVIPEGVTKLDKVLFTNSLSLKTVKLPKSLKTIDEGCFQGCANLEDVEIEDNNIEEIGKNAFFGTRNLKQFSFGENTKSIGDYSFAGSGLRNIDLIMPNLEHKGKFYKADTQQGKKRILNSEADGDSEVIADINIGYGAFSQNQKLTSVEFVCDKPINIGARAFEGCSELRTIKGDYRVRYIGDSAFEGTGEMNNVDTNNLFSPVLTYIGKRAFYESNLSGDVTVYDKVTNIGANAFYSAPIGNVTIYVDSMKSISEGAFSFSGLHTLKLQRRVNNVNTRRLRLEPLAFADCACLTSVYCSPKINIAEGDSAFSGCHKLIDVKLGGTYKIHDRMFNDCENLALIDITGMISVGDFAFCGTALTEVNSNAKEIGAYAFSETPITAINLPQVKRIKDSAFAKCYNIQDYKFSPDFSQKSYYDIFKNSNVRV